MTEQAMTTNKMTVNGIDVWQVARICHETNRAYCETIGDHTQKPWDEAEKWQRASAFTGALAAITNPDAPASAAHEAWVAEKVADGWGYGVLKDAVKKEHPCIVPYDILPVEQRLKDYLFRAIVRAFIEARAE